MPDAISAFGFLIPVVRASVILGLVVAGWLAVRFSKLTGDAAKKLESAVFGVTVAGLVGARLGFVVLNWNAFQNNLLSIFYVWQPGFSPWAGLFVGSIYAYVRYEQFPLYLRSFMVAFGTAALLPLFAFEATTLRLPGSKTVKIGDLVPNVRMVNLEGKPVSLNGLRGKTVVLNFWATWCPPCRNEMPMLESVAKEYQDKNVVIVGLDVGEAAERVQVAVTELGVTYPIWLNGINTNSSQAVFQEFGGVGLPTTVLIDKNGILRARQIGELNRASVTDWLSKP